VARQIQPANAPQPNDFAPRGVPIGGQQWRSQRASQDRLASQPLDRTAAASHVGFLLGGEDGEHAPEFLAAIRDAIQAGRAVAAQQSTSRRRGENQSASPEGQFENLIAANHSQYEAWLKDPKAGQPEYPSEPAAGAELDQAQREMLVVLKLQRRLSSQQAANSAVKVATFDRAKGRQAVGKPPVLQPITVAELAARLRDPSRPAIGTLDANGKLLLSTDRQRIDQLIGWDNQRYQLERRENQWVLVTHLADGRVLRGYLADNADKPSRPLAKFSVEEATTIGPKAKPVPQPAQSAVSWP
jgi:hypothetical protein